MWVFKRISNLLSKLVVLNSLVIILVLLLAGLSVKDYACYLVNSENITGQDLVRSLNIFLLGVSVFAFIIVGLLHYVSVKKMVDPLNHLSTAAKEIKEGIKPNRIDVKTSGEMKELIENFNEMSDRLHSVQERRDEMLKDIAHELRTPLTNINGYLEALQNEVIKGDTELFGSLLEESRRITRIVEFITELNSWTNGVYLSEKSFSPVKVSNSLSEALTSFHLKLKERFTTIDVSIENSTILGNRDGLMQVFTNILQNILDYSTGDDLTIKGEITNESYLITFHHKGQYIAPEKSELIFERFYRLEDSRTTKAYGAGLGLAIAKSIVTAHKGGIGVNTDGTLHTFWIKLPIINE